MIHAVGYRIRALANERSQISICVFGAVHLTVEATLDSQTAEMIPPTVLLRGTTGEGRFPEDLTAVECDDSCHDTIHSVRLMIELRDAVEHDVRSATRELLVRLQR